jgi:hypothetical protein
VDPYPRWRFFPAPKPHPLWVEDLAGVFAANRVEIDSAVTHDTRMQSNDVLRVVADDLEAMGFSVERVGDKLPRPVFFGDEGRPSRTYEMRSTPSTALRSKSRRDARRWATRFTGTSSKGR